MPSLPATLIELVLTGGLALASPADLADPVEPGGADPENILVLIADDVGVDGVAAYQAHPHPGPTPNLDKLAADGVLFRNVWSNPRCSPTRATLLTGRYAFRTGVAEIKLDDSAPGLRLTERTLPELLGPSWSTLALGKWHVATGAQGILHPLESGFGAYAGSRFNLTGDELDGDYFKWPKTFNFQGSRGPGGFQRVAKTYATTDTTDDAIAALRVLPEPWFLWVAYNAPHAPFHDPPAALHTQDLNDPSTSLVVRRYRAMKEALDSEVGRLLEHVPANTTVIFLGDNGPPKNTATPPLRVDRVKGTVYEGGIHVPLIVRGPRVARPGSECKALINTSDLYATLAEIAGVPNDGQDSVSFLPYLSDPHQPSLREFVYAQVFKPIGFGPYDRHARAARDARYKLIRHLGVSEPDELYDLVLDPLEEVNLVEDFFNLPQEHRDAFVRLSNWMEGLPGAGASDSPGDPASPQLLRR